MMVVPEGPESGNQEIVLITKNYEGKLHRVSCIGVRYVPLTDREKQWS